MNIKTFFFLTGAALSAPSALAQNSVQQVLNDIAAHNIHLKAFHQQMQGVRKELSTLNNLDDPEVEYIYQWASPADAGHQTELTVTQSFAFPTLYAERSRYGKIQGNVLEYQEQEEIQQVKLEAISLCIRVIGLNRRQKILEETRDNLTRLQKETNRKLQEGNAISLEVNKVGIELMATQTEVRQNELDKAAALNRLKALNGGSPVVLDLTEYPALPATMKLDDLLEEYHRKNATLIRLQEEEKAAGQQIRVTRQQNLPELEIGYRRNTALGEHFDGIVGGASIPLFSNRRKVSVAKAQLLSKQMELEDRKVSLDAEVVELYNRYTQLRGLLESMDRQVLENQSQSIEEALQLGKFTVLDYLVEYRTILDSRRQLQETEQEMQQTLAELLQYSF